MMSNKYEAIMKSGEVVALNDTESIVFQENSGTYDVKDKDGNLIGIFPFHSLSHIVRK